MTDRIKALTVILTADVREDDVQPLIDAIRMLRGVWSVESIKVNPMDAIERKRIRAEFRQKLWDALKN